MSTNVPFERRLAAWMVDEVGTVPPDDRLDEILSATIRTRPEPRWLVLLKESPMRANAQVAVGSPTRRLAFAAILALLLIGAALAAGAFVMRSQAAAGDWPMFRGGPDRSGAGLNGPQGKPQLHWRYQLAGIPGNVSVVGDAAYVATDNGALTAIDLATGRQRWSFNAQGALNGPSVADGLVYVADARGTAHAIDAANGTERWASSSTYPILTTATAGGGAVYFGLDDGGLLALDAKTGTERWRVAIQAGSVSHTAAYADGFVYVGNDAAGLVAVRADTGAVAWTLGLDGDVPGTPVVVDGIAYIGGNADAAHLRAADAVTGVLKWKIDHSFQTPAVANGVAFTTDSEGLVAAFRTGDGSELWHFRLPTSARPPSIADGIAYLATTDPGHAYAVDAATGGLLWDYPVDSAVQCCIVPAKGYAFVPTAAGTIYSLGGDGSTIKAAVLGDIAVTTSTVPPSSAPTPPPATPATSFPPVATADGMFESTGKRWAPQIMTRDPSGNFWIADPFYDRFAIFGSTGKFVEFWGKAGTGPGEFAMHRSNSDSYGSVGFASDGTMFALDVGNRRIQVFDRNRKFVKQWGSFGDQPGQFSEAVNLVMGPNDTVYVLDDVRGVIEHYARDGSVLDTFDAFPNARHGENTANALAIDAAGNLYVSNISPYQVTRFDPQGNVTQVFGSRGVKPGQFREQPGQMAIDARGRLFVNQGPQRGSQPAVYVFDKDGSYLGGFGTTDPGDLQLIWPTAMFIDGDKLYVGDVGTVANGSGTPAAVHRFTLLPPFAP